jgi:hypothetical protein
MNNEDNKKNGNTKTTYLERFQERLKTFPSQVGKRNLQLLGLVNYGVRAGMTDDKIEDEIVNGSGEPPLTLAEIRHALETARKSVGLFKQNATKTNLPPPLGPRSKDYVPDMMALGVGATEKSLTTVSPVAIPDDPLAQTKLFLSTLYTDTDFVFVGDKYDNGILGTTVQAISNWKQNCPKGPYLIINPLTGTQGSTKTGKPSYRCTSCISSLRYILVEADDATLEAQWAFWAGVISSQTLPLRSLVYSGNDSLHGIVEIAANNPEEWRTMQKKVMFAVAHPSAPRSQKADEACNNVDRLTRLAGATHPETKRLQRLLWLSHKPLGIN